MAKEYGIAFPLLEDEDLALAKKYTGVSESGYPMPSMYILRADGTVYLRRIATAKDDRVNAEELLEHLDAMLETAPSARVKARGYERPIQLTADLGLGVQRHDAESSFAGDLALRALVALGEYAALGLEGGSLGLPEREVRGALLVQGQISLWADVAYVYGQLPIGAAKNISGETSDIGLFTGLRLGMAFDASPSILMRAEVAFESADLGQDGEAARASRALLRLGAGWRF